MTRNIPIKQEHGIGKSTLIALLRDMRSGFYLQPNNYFLVGEAAEVLNGTKERADSITICICRPVAIRFLKSKGIITGNEEPLKVVSFMHSGVFAKFPAISIWIIVNDSFWKTTQTNKTPDDFHICLPHIIPPV